MFATLTCFSCRLEIKQFTEKQLLVFSSLIGYKALERPESHNFWIRTPEPANPRGVSAVPYTGNVRHNCSPGDPAHRKGELNQTYTQCVNAFHSINYLS